MKILWSLTLCIVASAAAMCGQAVDLKPRGRLADKASDVVDVAVDGALLKLGAKFLSADDPDQAKIKKLVAELKGIYVKTYKFEREGAYSESDIESIRKQLEAPGWSRIVGVRSKKKDSENAEIFLKTGGPDGWSGDHLRQSEEYDGGQHRG